MWKRWFGFVLFGLLVQGVYAAEVFLHVFYMNYRCHCLPFKPRFLFQPGNDT